jgi:hypothetical protein
MPRRAVLRLAVPSLALAFALACRADATGPRAVAARAATTDACRLTMEPRHLTLRVGHSAGQFVVDAPEPLTWATVDDTVAFVRATGMVMPIAEGETVVTATAPTGCSAIGYVSVVR